jgi:DNA-binding NarL/FixJ family response regulator
LILLDIGLPKLNGIEAARRIRKLCPESKIVFLSQEAAGDVIEEALNSGGTGYVVKTNAASELLDAIDGIRTGGQVVGTACR